MPEEADGIQEVSGWIGVIFCVTNLAENLCGGIGELWVW